MKFLIDAHLPRRLTLAIAALGYDTIHTLDLPDKNQTKDSEINHISINEQRIVVTKDADFVDSFLLTGKPYKLLLISTGNINNNDLINLILPQMPTLVDAFQSAGYIELNRVNLIIHQ